MDEITCECQFGFYQQRGKHIFVTMETHWVVVNCQLCEGNGVPRYHSVSAHPLHVNPRFKHQKQEGLSVQPPTTGLLTGFGLGWGYLVGVFSK